jgi:hypothetical protein
MIVLRRVRAQQDSQTALHGILDRCCISASRFRAWNFATAFHVSDDLGEAIFAVPFARKLSSWGREPPSTFHGSNFANNSFNNEGE